jgi:hypothetical protein
MSFRLAALSAACLSSLCAVSVAQANTLVGLTTTNQLVQFDSANPGMGFNAVSVSGLAMNERLLGMDRRPSDGLIYTLSNAGRLYTLDAQSGVASFVANLRAGMPAASGGVFMGLTGSAFGVDFNPVPDAGMSLPSLRVVSYTNNDTDPNTGTVLYGIDARADALFTTAAPNAGTMTRVGDLGVNVIGVTGFDVSGDGQAFAALTDGDTGLSALYRINLMTGTATNLGAFGIQGNTLQAPLIGLTAIPAVPEPSTWALAFTGLALVGMAARRRQRAA